MGAGEERGKGRAQVCSQEGEPTRRRLLVSGSRLQSGRSEGKVPSQKAECCLRGGRGYDAMCEVVGSCEKARSSMRVKAVMSDQRAEYQPERGGWMLKLGGEGSTGCQRQEPEARRQVR